MPLDNAVLGPPPALEDELALRIRDKVFGTAIAASPRIELPPRTVLQLAGCHVETLRDAARRPVFEDMAVLVGSNPISGRVRACRAFPESTEADDPPPSPPDPGEGVTGIAFRINLAELLELPMEPGSYCFWILARERASNPARMELFKPPPSPIDDPEVVKFIAQWRAANPRKPVGADPRTVWPPAALFGGYPSYRASDAAVPLPKHGIVLSAERVLVQKQGLRWVLSGAFRVAIDRRHAVLDAVSGESATAVVPISLVITGNAITRPVVLDLRLPTRSAIKSGEQTPVVEGHFSINLASLPGIRRLPGTYFIYAVCGEAISAPAVTALVAEEMLSS